MQQTNLDYYCEKFYDNNENEEILTYIAMYAKM